MKKLTTSHINALRKVQQQLSMYQTMNFAQIIMVEKNKILFDKANKLISDAAKLLEEVK